MPAQAAATASREQALVSNLRMLRIHTICSALLYSLCLSGCAVYEAMGGMPYAESEITFTSQPTTARVFECIQSAISSLNPERDTTIVPGLVFKAKQGWWATNVSRLNFDEGVLETGDYSGSNIAGVRLRAVYSQRRAVLRLQLKAAGPYYVDLGAQEHMNQLRSRVVPCVEA